MKAYALLLAHLLFCGRHAAAQKAFEAVYYKGTIHGRSLKLTLANGYVDGSTLKVTNKNNGKTLVYLPDAGYDEGHKELCFKPQTKSGTTVQDSVVLQHIEEVWNIPPLKIKGWYFVLQQRYRIILSR